KTAGFGLPAPAATQPSSSRPTECTVSLRKHIVVTGRGMVVGEEGENIDGKRIEVIDAAALAQAARAAAVAFAAVVIVVGDGAVTVAASRVAGGGGGGGGGGRGSGGKKEPAAKALAASAPETAVPPARGVAGDCSEGDVNPPRHAVNPGLGGDGAAQTIAAV